MGYQRRGIHCQECHQLLVMGGLQDDERDAGELYDDEQIIEYAGAYLVVYPRDKEMYRAEQA